MRSKKIVRGGAKGVKKAAQKVETRMDKKLNEKSDQIRFVSFRWGMPTSMKSSPEAT